MSYLILADGTIFKGKSVGVKGHALGEVMFNTSQTGYQEILTDPSYLGQIINFTTPHIGNVGVNEDDSESKKIYANGSIFRDCSEYYSNWRAKGSFKDFLKQYNIVAISDIDTRALTIILREHGAQNGCIVADETSIDEALTLIKAHPSLNNQNLAEIASTKKPYIYWNPSNYNANIVVIDCGVKMGILNSLTQYSVKITVVPQNISFEELIELKPDGVLLSNGPGDPDACINVIDLTKKILNKKIALFGICLGHQILALALNAKTKKMKFGHHGANHPIKCHKTGSVFISSQNHGFVVDELNLPECLEITHTSLFDHTIAGLRHRELSAFSFQGHPEASPGPNELSILFQQFIAEVNNAKK